MITYRATLIDPPQVDYDIPISSFQMRLRQSPDDCYLSVNCPDLQNHGSEIIARINGQLALFFNDEIQETELVTVNIDSFSAIRSPNSDKGEITGYRQITFSSPQVINTRVHYQSDREGVLRVRIPPVPVSPGDTVNYNFGSIVPTLISWFASMTRTQVELSNG